MPLLSQEHKHRALVQLGSDVSTRKFVALVGMNQSFVAYMGNNVGGEIERQRGWRPSFLHTDRRVIVSLLLLKVNLELHL